mmetsp:Transcript_150129/g.482546  ORF Transcript_150129/g.482546 Transcript_150129/m.482546 type:complete len:254 (-) Transcript_150129:1626-2387(-)
MARASSRGARPPRAAAVAGASVVGPAALVVAALGSPEVQRMLPQIPLLPTMRRADRGRHPSRNRCPLDLATRRAPGPLEASQRLLGSRAPRFERRPLARATCSMRRSRTLRALELFRPRQRAFCQRHWAPVRTDTRAPYGTTPSSKRPRRRCHPWMASRSPRTRSQRRRTGCGRSAAPSPWEAGFRRAARRAPRTSPPRAPPPPAATTTSKTTTTSTTTTSTRTAAAGSSCRGRPRLRCSTRSGRRGRGRQVG